MHAASLSKSPAFVKIKRIRTIVAHIMSLELGSKLVWLT